MPSSCIPKPRWAASLICCLIATVACAKSFGQDEASTSPAVTSPVAAPPGNWPFRYDLFKMSLERSGLKITTNAGDAHNAPRQSVIVFVGSFPISSTYRYYEEFVRNGGALLLASDQSSLVRGFGAIQGQITTTTLPAARYQNRDDCIRVSPAVENDLTKGVGELVFNRARHISTFSRSRFEWNTSVRWPDHVNREAARQPLIASAKTATGGRVILCADHSIFTNTMLWHADNALFVLKVTQALAGTGRDQLYFADGRTAQGSYEDDLKKLLANAELPAGAADQVPELEIEQMLRIADTVIANSEDANLLNAYLRDRPRRMSSRHYNRSILFGIVAAICCMAAYQLARRGAKPARRPAAPAVPTVVRKVLQPSEEKARQRGEAARLRSRDTLRKLTGSDLVQTWESFAAERANTREKYMVERLLNVATHSPMQLAQSDLLEVDSICRDLIHKFSSK